MGKGDHQVFSTESLLNECQKPNANHRKYAKLLWLQYLNNNTVVLEKLLVCFFRIVGADTASLQLERLIRFFGTFFASVKLACQDEEQHAPDASNTELCDILIEETMKLLLQYTDCQDKLIRLRTCHLIQLVMTSLPPDAELSEELLTELSKALRRRVNDKLVKTRVVAVKGLERLPLPGEDNTYAGDPVVETYRAILEREKSQEVRAAVVHCMPLANDTLQDVLDRTLDVAPQVRKAAYAKLEKTLPTNLSIATRALLVRRGIKDRQSVVQEAAVALLRSWLEGPCQRSVSNLLQLLDVEFHAEESELAVNALIESKQFDPVDFVKSEAGESSTSALIISASELLQPEQAFLWKCICCWLQGKASAKGTAAATTTGAAAEAEAATAADYNQLLDTILPDSPAVLLDLVQRHVAAGPAYRFATCQLLHIATTCMDWTDGASRHMACDLLHGWLLLDPSVAVDDDDGVAQQSPCAALLGAGGGGSWEAALLDLALKMHGNKAEFCAALLKALEDMERDWQLSGADAAGMLSRECQWRQLLGVLSLALERLMAGGPPRNLGPAAALLQQLQERLVMAAVSGGNAAIRQPALRCLALWCLTPLGRPTLRCAVPLLSSALLLDPDTQVQAAAGAALTDLAAVYGVAALDAARQAVESGSGSAAADATGDADSLAEGISRMSLGSVHTPQQGAGPGRSLVQVLLQRLSSLVSAAESAAATVAPTTRVGKKGASSIAARSDVVVCLDGSQASLVQVLVEGLAKLLAHQTFHRRISAANGASLALTDEECRLILAELLMVHCHPATEQLSQARQCLTVLFEVYMAMDALHKRQLAGVFLQVARRAAALGGGRKSAAPQVIKYMSQLMQLPINTPQQASGSGGDDDEGLRGDGEVDLGGEQLSDAILTELYSCKDLLRGTGSMTTKMYITELAKVLAVLPLRRSQQHAIKALMQAARSCEEALADGVLKRCLAAFSARLEEMNDPGVDPLSEEEVAAMAQRLDQLLQLGPGGLAGGVPDTPATMRRGGAGRGSAAATARRGSAAKQRPTTARRRKPATPSDDSEDEDSDSGGDEGEDKPGPMPSQRRQLSSRTARESASRRLHNIFEASSGGDSDDVDEADPHVAVAAVTNPAPKPTRKTAVSTASVDGRNLRDQAV